MFAPPYIYAPDDVTWEPGCAPLLRLHGDEYLVERA